MTKEEFSILDIERQAEEVWNKGTFIDTFVSEANSYVLYSIYNFYAEMTIERKHFQIIDISPVMDEKYTLEKYLDKIKIDSF